MVRKIALTILNGLAGITLIWTVYLLSLLSDYFPWGSSNRDGLYLLVIPLFILPAVSIVAIINLLLTLRFSNRFVKYSSLFIVLLVAATTLITARSTGEVSLMISIILLLAGVIAIAINIGLVFNLKLLDNAKPQR